MTLKKISIAIGVLLGFFTLIVSPIKLQAYLDNRYAQVQVVMFQQQKQDLEIVEILIRAKINEIRDLKKWIREHPQSNGYLKQDLEDLQLELDKLYKQKDDIKARKG